MNLLRLVSSNVTQIDDEFVSEVGYYMDLANGNQSEAARIMGVSRDVLLQALAVFSGKRELPSGPSVRKIVSMMEFIMDNQDLSDASVSEQASVSINTVRTYRRKMQEARLIDSRNYNIDPGWVGTRTLLARTCRSCGLFLPAKFFRYSVDGDAVSNRTNKGISKRRWNSECTTCRRKRAKQQPMPGDTSEERRLQVMSLPFAKNSGKYWSKDDDDKLKDKTVSNIQAAVELGRTYFSVLQRRQRIGIAPARPGDPVSQQWVIRFIQ